MSGTEFFSNMQSYSLTSCFGIILLNFLRMLKENGLENKKTVSYLPSI